MLTWIFLWQLFVVAQNTHEMQNLNGVSNGSGCWMRHPLTGKSVTCEADAARIALASRASSVPK